MRTAVGTPISLCMDRTLSLVATFSTVAPAIVDYGWDGARSGTTLLASTAQSIKVPSPEREGMRILMTKPVLSPAAIPEVAVQNP